MESPVKTRRTRNKNKEHPEPTPEKGGRRTRAAVEGQREGPRNPIPRATIKAKATEAAAKYLDGTWGPEGGHRSLTRAVSWLQAELEDTREWSPQNLMYYVNQVRGGS